MCAAASVPDIVKFDIPLERERCVFCLEIRLISRLWPELLLGPMKIDTYALPRRRQVPGHLTHSRGGKGPGTCITRSSIPQIQDGSLCDGHTEDKRVFGDRTLQISGEIFIINQFSF